MNLFHNRRERLQAGLDSDDVQAFLVSNPVNVTYLTGFTGDSSYLLLTRDQAVLLSDSRFVEQLAEECPDLECYIRPATQSLHQATARILDSLAAPSVAIESSHLTVADLENLSGLAQTVSWKPTRDHLENLRVIKDASEIDAIKRAVHIAERAFAALILLAGPGDSEKSLSDAMEHYIRMFGGAAASFRTIVAVDERSALPHAPPTERTLGEACFALIDWGACERLYKCDLTRVLLTHKNSAFSDTAARERLGWMESIHTVVLRARDCALAMLRPGVKAREVDAAARDVIAGAGFANCFGHGLGHGLGLQLHEAPSLRPNSEHVLAAGMVLTIEPAIYVRGKGGVRIEDDVLITPDGYERLTTLKPELQAVAFAG